MRKKEIPGTDPIYGILTIGIMIVAAFGFFYWLVTGKSDEISKIENEGISTEAYLVKKVCNDHHAIIYEFIVDGKKLGSVRVRLVERDAR